MGLKVVGLVGLLISIGVYYLAQNDVFSDEVLKDSLHDKVVVICGASSGIGEVTAYKYAGAGAKLVLSARSLDKLQTVKNNALERGAKSVDIVTQDFSKTEEIEKYRERVLAIHPTIDVLLLNHAALPIMPWMALPPHKQAPEYTRRIFNINVLSFIELTRVFLDDLEASAGQIQVTSSVAGIIPHFEFGLYGSTKHAVNGFFYSLQQEVLAKQSRVSVSVFSLGLIMTDNMDAMFSTEQDTQKIPNFVKGDVNQVAHIIVSATISRPRNVDYPIASVKFMRSFFHFFPNYHDIVIASTGKSYSETVEVQQRLEDASKTILNNYQVGNI